MKAKTYKAKSIQLALDQIKKELGSDAMILSTQAVAGRRAFGLIRRENWEVTAAIKDAPAAPAESKGGGSLSSFLGAWNGRTAPEIDERPERKRRGDVLSLKTPVAVAEPPVRSTINDSRIDGLLEEFQGLKQTLQLISRSIPAGSRDISGVCGELVAAGMEPALADSLVSSASRGNPPADELRNKVRAAIASTFLVEAPVELAGRARTISVFAGPSGAGKTTTIAKIAGHAKAKHKKRVTLISMDTFRVGGQEQLSAYGNLLDIPTYACADVAALNKLIGMLNDDLILIDTPGASLNGDPRMNGVKAIVAIPNARVHVVLSAGTRTSEISRIVNGFAGNTAKRIIITKLDEVEDRAAFLASTLSTELPISYVTDGSNVPGDLSVPSAEDLASSVLPAKTLEGLKVAL